MRTLVTRSTSHLGEALVRTLSSLGSDVVGLDLVASPFTNEAGSIADRSHVKRWMNGVDAAIHTATLHKPHISTHTRQDFIDTIITGTRNLLQEAASVGVASFIFTSTTSAFGGGLTPSAGAPAVWVTEDITPVPRNIYGVTKRAAEDLCELFHRSHGLACLILRTARFFPEEDDRETTRQGYADDNVKVNEYLSDASTSRTR
jgi:UDP-glucose 4-epimerase